MHQKQHLVLLCLFGAFFGFVIMFLPGWGLAVNSAAEEKADVFSWQISDAQIVEAAMPSKIRQGTIVHDYTIKATATAANENTPIKEGIFTLKSTVFAPSQDMPGQPAGYWYLNGEWTITDLGADPKVVEIKHNPHKVDGVVQARLSFNPAKEMGTIDAKVSIPSAPNAGQWTSGDGKFSGNEKFEGSMSLNVDRRPSVSTGR